MRLAYSTFGPIDAPVVVFLHGFLGSRRDWDEIIPGLKDRYRCVAIDLPGHGESKDDSEPYSMEIAATAIIEIIDKLNASSFSLAGYSLGGRLALYVASIYAMRIDALVLESASPGLRTEQERAERRDVDEGWVSQIAADFESFLRAWYAQPIFKNLTSFTSKYQQMLNRRMLNSPHHIIRAMRGFSVASQTSLWDEWRSSHIPALLIAGEHDSKYHALLTEMWEGNASSSLSVIQKTGHNVHLEAPDEYTRVIRAFFDSALG